MHTNHRMTALYDFNLHDIGWNANDDNSYFLPTGLVNHDSQYHTNANEFLAKMQDLPLYQISNIRNTSMNVLHLVFVDEYNGLKLKIDISELEGYNRMYTMYPMIFA